MYAQGALFHHQEKLAEGLHFRAAVSGFPAAHHLTPLNGESAGPLAAGKTQPGEEQIPMALSTQRENPPAPQQ